MLEVSWLLHHNTEGDDMRMWLYGTKAGSLWPKCEIYESNYDSMQLYNRQLKLMPEPLPAHAQECVDFAQAIVDGAPSPVPPEESLQVMQILDAIYRSEEKQREIIL